MNTFLPIIWSDIARLAGLGIVLGSGHTISSVLVYSETVYFFFFYFVTDLVQLYSNLLHFQLGFHDCTLAGQNILIPQNDGLLFFWPFFYFPRTFMRFESRII